MSRCLDDHPQAICLCEAEINRALFQDYFVALHFRRMSRHGLAPDNIAELLNGRKQDDFSSLIAWYADSQQHFSRLYNKPELRAFGDKSPDFYRCPQLVAHLAENYPLIYTVRDPRAIYCSIRRQQDASEQEKQERWADLAGNYLAWEPHLDRDNVLCIRYEDLLMNPGETMASVYRHLGLEPSERFLEPFVRAEPSRFLWRTAVDWESGIGGEFDTNRTETWRSEWSEDDLRFINGEANVSRFMDRFGYSQRSIEPQDRETVVRPSLSLAMKTPRDKLFIPPPWKKWIAENVLRDGDPTVLTRILVENGFSEPLARQEVDAAAGHPYTEAARSLGRQLKKRDWIFDTLRLLQNESKTWQVERRERVSSDEFLEQYYYQNRPVILTDAMKDWKAMQRWTPAYLKERCGEQMVQVQARRNSNARYEIENQAHKSTIRFADYVDAVFQADATNDFYMTANNSGANREILPTLREDFDLLPDYLDARASDKQMFFWFGPAGTVTPVHHDLTNNFMAQVVGRKQLKLIAPVHHPNVYNHLHCYSQVDLSDIDFERYPQFRHVKVHEITLHPGELFFLPIGWWHHVRGLDATITLTCTNFRARNDFATFYNTYGAI